MSKKELDKHFGQWGPCVCHSRLDARHRVVAAIQGAYRAGQSIESLAEDYSRPVAAIEAAINARTRDNYIGHEAMKQ